MIEVFLSYARADGLAAATAVRRELAGMGLQVWRDIEEMRGGLAWKEQLGRALEKVDVVLVFLTPAAAASQNVEWEWRRALALEKRLIPLLIAPCNAPAELKQLHYHDLSDPAQRRSQFNKLVRDLFDLAALPAKTETPDEATYAVGRLIGGHLGDEGTVINEDSEVEITPEAESFFPPVKARFVVGTAVHSHVGKGGLVVNRGARVREGPDLEAYYLILEALKSLAAQLPGEARPHLQEDLAETGLQLSRLAEKEDNRELALAVITSLKRVESSIEELRRDVREAHDSLVRHFDQAEQRLLKSIVDRLDEQQAAEAEAMIEAINGGRVAEAELQLLQEAVEQTLAEVRRIGGAFPDPALAGDVTQLDEWVSAPQLEAKQRLLVTIPIVPFFVSYEGEIELKSAANLEAAWRRLQQKIRG